MSLKNEQLSFDSEQRENKRVTVLGMEFENDDARREYFREELRKKLPELREIEGFPIGNDESIINLSDPPFYTACPNPWQDSLISSWEKDNQNKEKKLSIPFTSDVSEGKYDINYKLHPYSTKVPHKAIMRYILHYTRPGEIIFDGFSGTGMTGVAAQACDDKKSLLDLGYKPKDNVNYVNDRGQSCEKGPRRTILNDLSTIGGFLSYQHNKSLEEEYQDFIKQFDKVMNEYGFLYKTLHDSQKSELFCGLDIQSAKEFISTNQDFFGDVNYVLWSDVFECNICNSELIFWDSAVDEENGKVKTEFTCPYCGVNLTKKKIDKVFESVVDELTGETLRISKQVPIKISYTFNGKKYEKLVDNFDKFLIKNTNLSVEKKYIPVVEFKNGDETKRLSRNGIKYIHQMYSKKNLLILASLRKRIDMRRFGPLLTRVAMQITKLYRYTFQNGTWGAGGGPLSGTLYIPSLVKDLNITRQISAGVSQYNKREKYFDNKNIVVSTSSSTKLSNIKSTSVDYIFVDPPFGENLMYSELNLLWEYWIGIYTNDKTEAIMNTTQHKGTAEYHKLMTESFKEMYRILKEEKWITVEFSNTSSSIWNVIQNAIQEAGFIIANVSVLDKKKGSFKVVTSMTAVKQDLVISAYKPKGENLENMKRQRNSKESSWIFINQHLSNLPIFMGEKGSIDIISERTPRILFDRMVAYHVQQGLPVSISSAEFQLEIVNRHPMRDGMVFLDSQVAEYDKKRILAKEFSQLSLFVSDENSAIEWIRQQLMKKPQSRQDIHPQFMKEIQHIAKYEELPELDELLAQNFLYYDGDEAVPNQISTYLTKNYHDLRGLERDDVLLREKAKNRWYVPNPNQQADLEKLREKSLLREFGHYLDEINNSKKKLKVFRTEAIRVGFKKAWTEKEYQTIVTVGERLPEKVIQEDDKLLMYYDNALMRTEM